MWKGIPRKHSRARRASQVRSAGAVVAIACACAALIPMLGVPGVALADSGRQFLTSIGEGPAGKPLEEPAATAVDHATGDVFVADPGRGVVDVFTSSGGYVTRFGEGLEPVGLAVDEASGDVYVAEPWQDSVLVFKPDGQGGYELLSSWSGEDTPGGAFGEVAGVAVDNSTSPSDPAAGDVYVVNSEGLEIEEGKSVPSERGEVYVFSPRAGAQEAEEGEYLRSVTGVKLEEPNGVAVSAATGEVYVAESVKGSIDTFSSAGVFEAKLRGVGSPLGSLKEGDVDALAIDETTGDLLVAESEQHRVSELSSSGEWLGWVTGSTGGPLGEPDGVAVNDSGDLYVADASSHAVDEFGPALTVPEAKTKKASKIGETTAELNGTVEGEGEPVTYRFEWGETEAFGSSTPSEAGTGAGEEQATATITGLKPDTTYYFRLVGEDADGISCGLGRTFTTAPGEASAGVLEAVACQLPRASIDSESATEVGSAEATLQAQIDPRGRATSYVFQYGTESCRSNPGACTELPSPPVPIGSGGADVPVSIHLQELTAGATYHYRVLATNSLGTAEGVERTFTAAPAATPFALPDGRAWELVTPPDKHGASVEAITKEGGLILASESGDALAYVANGAITEAAQGNRSFEPQQVLATRDSRAWTSQDIATPQTRALGSDLGAPQYQFFSPDLSLGLVEPFGAEPPLAPGVAGHMIYLRDDQQIAPEAPEQKLYEEAEANAAYLAPGFLPLVSELNTASEANLANAQVQFAGASPDLRNIVFHASVALTGSPSGPGLYEWSDGSLEFVSELPGGTPAHDPMLGDSLGRFVSHAISSDGSRVIWTDSSQGAGHLYMTSRNIATGEPLAVQLDKAQGVAEPESGAAEFQAASSDGSRVLFTDEQALTAGSSAEPKEEAADLYECEMVPMGGSLACDLQDLTQPVNPGEHAAVQGRLLGVDEEATEIYLVARGVLAVNENGNGERARSGEDNLYAFRYDGGKWTRTFIAQLSGEDARDWDAGKQGEGVIAADTSFLTARVSPDGEYLAFMSERSLTGYDNEDVSSEQSGERRLDEEVYLYDSSTASLGCVSCDPSGARPVGVLDQEDSGEGLGLVVDRRETWRGRWLAASIPGWTARSGLSALFQSRYLSNEGRLFFDSADALVPQLATPTRKEDIAGEEQKVGVENVYEYEPAGVGSCESATGGCVALISSGTSEKESAFLEATPNGEDVFFLTAAQLLAQDTDTSFDIYDARVCTGESPCLTPPSTEASGCSSADACRPASPVQPAPGGPSGSATFSGPGNASPPAAKQEVKGEQQHKQPPTRTQELAKALATCRKQHPHSKKKRLACEAHARKLYGPRKQAKKSARAAGASGDATQERER